MKTKGQCLRNNWNSFNDSKGEERELRLILQNTASKWKEEDCIWYEKNMWNERAEKELKKCK